MYIKQWNKSVVV